MSESTFGGGVQVKASQLVVGDFIRDPKRKDRILIVESLGSQIFARGYEPENESKHISLSPDTYVIRVTNANTDTGKGVS